MAGDWNHKRGWDIDVHDYGGSVDVALFKRGMAALGMEALVWTFYAVTCPTRKGAAHAMPAGKTPRSLPSNIVTRTTVLISGAMAVLSLRDLLFPGMIMEFWPRDDVYLEWTNALRHSPPPGSPEWHESGLDAPLFSGRKPIKINKIVATGARWSLSM